MPRDDRRSRAARNPQVWLLGNRHLGADISIGWDDEFPNLSDPDVLVVDLTTLTEEILYKTDWQKLAQAREALRDKLFHGGSIIVVSQRRIFARPPHVPPADAVQPPRPYSPSNYSIFPVSLETKSVPAGRRIIVDDGHDFKAYMSSVKSFTFYIKGYEDDYGPQYGHPRRARLMRADNKSVKDNSENDLGFTLVVTESDDGAHFAPAKNAGQLVFLPPPTGPTDGAIGKILAVYGKSPLREEVPPAWLEKVAVQKGMQLQAEIDKLEEQGDQIWARMDALVRERDGVLAHRRLLHSKGGELEAAVADAFRLLGLDAWRTNKADEDCILAMDAGGYAHGVVEVKGADGRTRQQDIVQCGKWVDVWYAREGELPKGVFVPNQHRMKEYPKSEQERLRFEPNELEYAEAKDICIIPSCALFEAAKRALDGVAPDRAEIEARIAGTRGVLDRVF